MRKPDAKPDIPKTREHVAKHNHNAKGMNVLTHHTTSLLNTRVFETSRGLALLTPAEVIVIVALGLGYPQSWNLLGVAWQATCIIDVGKSGCPNLHKGNTWWQRGRQMDNQSGSWGSVARTAVGVYFKSG
ncbi:hypothetical protein M407DRAFT_12266 [Tulasnella calospora MUT 4182]|uniref:Uncharacterized protein n=1 Tax=Tulasnella calospora MUT 4182 TaxID=1051891 RepID=A0A0C3Q3I8_9AGAM|nr:hypothetical protein M407DRAFT_12266 [Tulasnella calospora MUT 4182]